MLPSPEITSHLAMEIQSLLEHQGCAMPRRQSTEAGDRWIYGDDPVWMTLGAAWGTGRRNSRGSFFGDLQVSPAPEQDHYGEVQYGQEEVSPVKQSGHFVDWRARVQKSEGIPTVPQRHCFVVLVKLDLTYVCTGFHDWCSLYTSCLKSKWVCNKYSEKRRPEPKME